MACDGIQHTSAENSWVTGTQPGHLFENLQTVIGNDKFFEMKDTWHLPEPCPFLLSPADSLKVCP